MAYPDGKFGWIGLVATAPGFQRRGIATAITEHLARCACRSRLRTGARRFGRRWAGLRADGLRRPWVDHGDGRSSAEPHEPTSTTTNATPLTADDFDEVVRFDAPRFGATRRALLAKVIDQHPAGLWCCGVAARSPGISSRRSPRSRRSWPTPRSRSTSLVTAALRLDWPIAAADQRSAGERSPRHAAATRLRGATRTAPHAQRYRGVARPPREHRRRGQPRRGLIEFHSAPRRA